MREHRLSLNSISTMTKINNSEHSIRSFSTEVSEHMMLEISFIDLGSDSTVTSVILVLDGETAFPKYRHITKKVMSSWGLHQYCVTAMKDYLKLTKEPDDERYNYDEAQQEFARLDDYKTFLH